MIKNILFLIPIIIFCSFTQAMRIEKDIITTCHLYGENKQIIYIFTYTGVYDKNYNLIGYYSDEKVKDSENNVIADCRNGHLFLEGSFMFGKICTTSSSNSSIFLGKDERVYNYDSKEIQSYFTDNGCIILGNFLAAVTFAFNK
jgi:hypothetical protein